MKKYDFYIAGPCDTEHRSAMVNIARFLRGKEKKVYCPWELHIENAWDMSQEEWARKVFEADIKAISDIQELITFEIINREGAHPSVENSAVYDLPSDFLYYVSGMINLSGTLNPVTLVSHEVA